LGHKVHPHGFRLGVIKGWDSRWYAGRNYKDLLAEDRKLRAAIRKRLANAGVSRIEIERVAGTQIGVSIHTAKPGIVIGRSGESVERLRQDLERLTKKKVRLNILEIRNPDVDATLVARAIAEQLEKRVSFRRAMKQAVQKAMRAGAKGIRVVAGGRLGGAEIARTEKEVEGSVPLQTLRANIDFGMAEAHTTFGVCGVKVWIYHGEILPEKQRAEGLGAGQDAALAPAPGGGGDRRDRGDRGDRGGRGGERGDRGERGRGGERSGGAPRSGGGRGPAPAGSGRPRSGAEGAGPRPARAPRAQAPQAAAPRDETPVTPTNDAPAQAADEAQASAPAENETES
jgi:small subunit ribosomal protein S3